MHLWIRQISRESKFNSYTVKLLIWNVTIRKRTKCWNSYQIKIQNRQNNCNGTSIFLSVIESPAVQFIWEREVAATQCDIETRRKNNTKRNETMFLNVREKCQKRHIRRERDRQEKETDRRKKDRDGESKRKRPFHALFSMKVFLFSIDRLACVNNCHLSCLPLTRMIRIKCVE